MKQGAPLASSSVSFRFSTITNSDQTSHNTNAIAGPVNPIRVQRSRYESSPVSLADILKRNEDKS